jgi:hypothetical protein
MVTAIAPNSTLAQPFPINTTILSGIQWSTYQNLVQDLASQPGMRLTYDDGILEILIPPHERYKKLLGRFVEVMTEELGSKLPSTDLSTGKVWAFNSPEMV